MNRFQKCANTLRGRIATRAALGRPVSISERGQSESEIKSVSPFLLESQRPIATNETKRPGFAKKLGTLGPAVTFLVLGLAAIGLPSAVAQDGELTRVSETRSDRNDGDSPSDPGWQSIVQEVRGGTTWTPYGRWESIGTIPGCTATLITEYAALTAAHCVTDGSTVAFTLPNGRGQIQGRVTSHPLFNDLSWLSYDYALVRFSKSIFDEPSVSSDGLQPIPIATSDSRAGDPVVLYGYGRFLSGCSAADGKVRWARASIESVDEDWHYHVRSSAVGLCPGDSGGPLLSGDGKQVVAVNSWSADPDSYMKSTAMVSDWITELAGSPSLPGNTWGECVYYPNETNGDYLSVRGNLPRLGDHGLDQSISKVWVRKGFEATLFGRTNYRDQLLALNGFGGDSCNEHGCLHDLSSELAADDSASSATCRSAIPTKTWGWCVLYDNFGDGSYFSTRGDTARFDRNPTWDNRANQLWVKSGRTAELFPRKEFTDDRSRARLYDGYTGDWCNQFGCLHDLSGTVSELNTSSLICR